MTLERRKPRLEPITVVQYRQRSAWHSEQPRQTADRMANDYGLVEAIKTAHGRWKVHQDSNQFAHKHWQAVLVYLLPRLSNNQLKELGMKPK